MGNGKIINEETEIIYDEEKNIVTFSNIAKDGSIYINTVYLKDKEEEKEEEKDKEEEKEK